MHDFYVGQRVELTSSCAGYDKGIYTIHSINGVWIRIDGGVYGIRYNLFKSVNKSIKKSGFCNFINSSLICK